MKRQQFLMGMLVGAAVLLLLFLTVRKCTEIGEPETATDYYILKNQISKMNKMVVMEQDFSTMMRTKVAYKILGNKVSENEIITFTKTNAQVSYDLNKMKIDVDSVNRRLIIESLPEADIRISPNVEIQSMDDSFFNRIDENQIKKVTQSAKDDAFRRVDQKKLREDGSKQLKENLNNILVLAKALNYEIVDRTNTLPLNNL